MPPRTTVCFDRAPVRPILGNPTTVPPGLSLKPTRLASAFTVVTGIVVWTVSALIAAPQPPQGQPPTSSHSTEHGDVDSDQVLARAVAVVLATNCLECHRGAAPQGGLDLTRRPAALRGGESGPPIVAGNPDKSLLWKRVEAHEMPPKHRLSEADKQTLKQWIARGAKWGTGPIDFFQFSSSQRAGYDWWALRPLHQPNLPAATNDASPINEIDRFIHARLRANGLAPAPRADPRTLLRRLHFDLLGLPASPEAIGSFEANPSQTCWEQLVNELLASKHYGERWARHWLDVARFGESHGYEYNVPRKDAWHYRDWVIRSLNRDLPYDRFAHMQIAGDIVEPHTVDGAAAAGFLVAGIHNTVLGKNPLMKASARHDELEEIAGTVAQTFLGLTVNCARCHDHKFDPISTEEYYQFIAALDGVTHGQRTISGPSSANALTTRHQLENERDQLQGQLIDLVLARGGQPSRAANQMTLRDPIPANRKGVQYRISVKIAPTVWAAAAQATQDRDGISVRVIRQDGSVLASHRMRAGAWQNKNTRTFLERHFAYSGDGTGGVVMQISSFPIHANRFGGAVDDLTIVDDANRTIFRDSFDTLKHHHPPGVQADTQNRVYFGSTSRHWKHSGTNAIHSVEHRPGNLGVQFYGGTASGPRPRAVTEKEKQIQAHLVKLDSQINGLSVRSKVSVFTVVPGTPVAMRILDRGQVTSPGKPVPPGGLRAIATISSSFGIRPDATDAERRTKLADWITHRDNGPFHRVIVNRIWHYHFGQGLIDSPNDLGFNGGRPSHPELLNWLAVWFRENGYSLKKLHRLIVTSSTYQQSSSAASNAAQLRAQSRDQTNRLLWRQNPRRIDAETLRDSLLDIAGQLNRRRFGPGFEDVRIETVGAAHYYIAVDRVGDAFNRRTIYRWQVRGERSALLETFDCPDPSTTAPRRNVTTTPSQALSQWNHPFVLRMARKLADRVTRESGSDVARQVVRAWRLVLGRAPDDEEKERAIRLVAKHDLSLLARVLFNCNELILIE